jgi:branched-chain amino acid transport system ATP-binding protein
MSSTHKRPDDILLQVQDVHVAYGKAEVVHGASMDVRKGEFVVLLGRNGAGKSALLQAMFLLMGMTSRKFRLERLFKLE